MKTRTKIRKKKVAPKLSITINEFGQMVMSKDYEEINNQLDRSLFDKKMRIPTK